MKRNDFKNAAQISARGAVYVVLGILSLVLPYFVESLDMITALLASLLVFTGCIEHGKLFAGMVYGGVSILSVVLMPMNTGAVLFALAFGWFPLLWIFTEKKLSAKWLRALVRCAAFTIGLCAVVLLFFKSFVQTGESAAVVLKIASFFSADTSSLAEKLNETVLFSLTLSQALEIAAYALFAIPFSLIYATFLERFSLFYLIKLRPMLQKAGIVKK